MPEKQPNQTPFHAPQQSSNNGEKNSQNAGAFANQVKSSSIQLEVPQITLPKGGGALKGIDEKFQVNAANGTAGFSMPLPISKTRSDIAPALSLSYNTGAGNGCFGLGWSVDYPSIQRKTDQQLPLYKDAEDSDTFMFTGVEDLVPYLERNDEGEWVEKNTSATTGEKVRRYRPRIEGSFIRIERITPKASATFYWKVTTPNNVVTIFGKSPEARIADPQTLEHIFKWLPELSYDDRGNCMEYEYVKEDLTNVPKELQEKNRFIGNAVITNSYLKRVKYGNKAPYHPDPKNPYNPKIPEDPQYLFEVVWDFGDHDLTNPTPAKKHNWPCRIDPFSGYRAGFEIRTYRLCQRILFFHYFKELNDNLTTAPCLVRSLILSYRYFNYKGTTDKEKRNAETDYITSIQQFGYKKNGDSYTNKGLPPVTFTYQEPQWKTNIEEGLQWDTTIQDVSPENIIHAPIGIGPNYQWVDLWSEGLSGILTEQADSWFYKSNLGGGEFTVAEPVIPKPSFLGLSTGQLQLQDLEADGRKFVTSLGGVAKGYLEIADDKEWKPFKSFHQLPNINFNDPNTKFIDLNGDGKAELVVSEENAFTWYPNLGVLGYDSAEVSLKPYDEEKGAALVFSDPEQRIFLADMSGDGLTDILRIRNGEICYWPNLGYGRFGAKVSMRNAPKFDTADLFNPAYLHLADISGTGATDILYLGKNKGNAWLNLSGNGWSETVTLDPFFNTELLNQISVVDLLGNGTACIVWSSPLPRYANAPMRYIDLMGGKKPYILTAYQNNMGKEVSWDFKSSTFYYLEDKKSGIPWVTKLPFPVQCVNSVKINDKAAGTLLTNSYSYHHGYYDHAEREFRGFGRVEQQDTEVFENFVLTGAANVTEKELHQPPVKTITWFHTGAFFGRGKILNQFKDEYRQELYEFDLPEPLLPDGLTAVEYREALRACKGTVLRQEVYTSGDTAEGILHSVAKHNCLIKQLQPRQETQFAVFLMQESEAATFFYEKDTDDPRIAHTFNLEVDVYGLVRQAAAVVYGRKKQDNSLPKQTREEQSKNHIIYTVNAFTHNLDKANVYRLPLPAETKTFELTGISPEGEDPKPGTAKNLAFTIAKLLENFAKATEIGYEKASGTSKFEKRLIEQVRSIYLSNDLINPLPFKHIDTLALPYQQYKLALTPSLVTNLYGDRVTNEMLETAKYVQLDEVNWWVASGTTIYLNEGETELNAQKRFYLPVALKDPFGNQTTLTYDEYGLFLKETEDPLHNKAVVEAVDYRLLAPARIRDINNNISEVVTDELGMVIATSVYGDEIDRRHGDEPLSSYTIIQPVNLNEVISNPHKFLQKATTFFYYDLNAWQEREQPVCFANVVRETHQSELAEGKTTRVFSSVGYTGGLGQNLQSKVQAEPGKAKHWQAGTLEEVDTSPNLRWVGTGRTILNNKGNPVKQYEPFFSTTYAYEKENELVEIGYSSILYYDALGRNIKVEHPNGTFSKFEFTAWKQLAFDENDTVLESDWFKEIFGSEPLSAEPKDPQKRAAWLAVKHANTPSEAHLDSLGRAVLTVANNGPDGKYNTHSVLDIENNQRAVIDARGNTVMQFHYDMLGRSMRQEAMDSGNRWLFPDAMDKSTYAWDSRKHRFHTGYDELNRPTGQWLVEGVSKIKGLTEEEIREMKLEKQIGFTVYGEEQPEDTKYNLRGKLFQSFDQSGLTQTGNYDFKGNVKNSFKRLASDYKNTIDWNIADPLLLLEQDPPFASTARFNAVNHPVEMSFPDGSTAKPIYNEANLLKALNAFIKSREATIQFIQNINYNAKGQRERIVYGNNTATGYTYDEKTYRLTRLLTTRNKGEDILQDLNYSYDPVGNITQIIDQANQEIFFNNSKIDPGNQFTYDALYRLVWAKGREHTGQNSACDQFDRDKTFSAGGARLTLPGDMNAMQNYEQFYEYDEVGNMEEMIHKAGIGTFENRWTRTFQYNSSNNRLKNTTVGGRENIVYQYDAHGNMNNLQKGSFNLNWNYADQLQQVDLGGGGMGYYVYDSSGQRVRKVIVNGVLIKERIYLGSYEVYREKLSGVLQMQRETLHIMDDQQRIALVEARKPGTPKTDAGLPFLIRYQYSNHLGSAIFELDGDAKNPNIISYEEYYPYGSTAYQATRNQTETPKRYRYTSKERDKESGLYYHGARYYAPWLVRWVSCDPAGIKDGLNLYEYVSGDPIRYRDLNGMWRDLGMEAEAKETLEEQKYGNDKPKKPAEEKDGLAGELIAGDFHKGESTWEGVAGSIVIGLIPIVGQVADIRDTAAAAKKVKDKPGSWESWAQLGMAAVGWVPGIGDAVKGGGKLVKKAATEGAKKVTKEAASEGVSKLGKEAIDRSVESSTKIIKSAADLKAHLHHLFPQEFFHEFRKHGIDVDDYIIALEKNLHIGKEGLHLKTSYNFRWQEFLEKNKNLSKAEFKEAAARELNELFKEADIDITKYPIFSAKTGDIHYQPK